MNIDYTFSLWTAGKSVCKSIRGGCVEWEYKSLNDEGGFYLTGGYTVQQCFDKCKGHSPSKCETFLIVNIGFPGYPKNSCLLYKKGCTANAADRRFDFYDLEQCTVKGKVSMFQLYFK